MTATQSGPPYSEHLLTTSVDASYAVERSAMSARVWRRLRRMADSAVKCRMSTEMADLAQQIRKIQNSDRA